MREGSVHERGNVDPHVKAIHLISMDRKRAKGEVKELCGMQEGTKGGPLDQCLFARGLFLVIFSFPCPLLFSLNATITNGGEGEEEKERATDVVNFVDEEALVHVHHRRQVK